MAKLTKYQRGGKKGKKKKKPNPNPKPNNTSGTQVNVNTSTKQGGPGTSGNTKKAGRPKGSKNKKKGDAGGITNKQAAAKLGSSAWNASKWTLKNALKLLGAKEVSDMTGFTDLIFPEEVPANFKDYKVNTGDNPGTQNRSNPNTNKSNKYRFGGHAPQSRGVGGRKVPGMYQDGGSIDERKKDDMDSWKNRIREMQDIKAADQEAPYSPSKDEREKYWEEEGKKRRGRKSSSDPFA